MHREGGWLPAMASSTSGITGEAGKEKEMLTSGDMILSVIPGPGRGPCDLGVPS